MCLWVLVAEVGTFLQAPLPISVGSLEKYEKTMGFGSKKPKLWKSQGETLVKSKGFFFASYSETNLEATGHQQSVGKECGISYQSYGALGLLKGWDPSGDSETVKRS